MKSANLAFSAIHFYPQKSKDGKDAAIAAATLLELCQTHSVTAKPAAAHADQVNYNYIHHMDKCDTVSFRRNWQTVHRV